MSDFGDFEQSLEKVSVRDFISPILRKNPMDETRVLERGPIEQECEATRERVSSN